MDHWGEGDLESLEIHQQSKDGSWWKVIGIPITGLPIFGVYAAFQPLFKVVIRGQRSQANDSEVTMPEE